MKPTVSAWIAAASIFIVAVSLTAAIRPRYGGTLRVEMIAALDNLTPSEIPSDPAALSDKAQWIPSVFETLVRLDDMGVPRPWLATSWTHDAARKRWVFAVRPNVRLHSGTLWNPPGGVVEVADDKPLDQILQELARPWNAIAVKEPDGSLSGTGPFKIARWDARRGATLVAHDAYWNGRPYLDSIEIQMGRELRDQAQDLQLGKVDVSDAATGVGAGKPDQVIALLFENARVLPAVREAVSLSIDRTTIHRVLLKDRGEISGALLPQWLTGYTFLFVARRDLDRARQLASAAAGPLSFVYDRQDGTLRSIAERISVNATEAGITMRPSTGAADVRLMVLTLTSRNEDSALADFATVLKTSLPSSGSSYSEEKSLLDGFRVIPLFHVARGWNIAGKVENWPDVADVWIDRP